MEVGDFLSWIYEEYVKKGSIIYNSIDKISIKNYFSLKDLTLNKLKNKKEIYILGENGAGKTLFLQAILLATKWHFIQKLSYDSTGRVRDYFYAPQNENLEIIIEDDGLSDTKSKFIATRHPSTIEKEAVNSNNLIFQNIFAYGVYRYTNERAKDAEGEHEFLSLFGKKSTLINPINWLVELFNREQAEQSGREVRKPHISLENATKLVLDILEEENVKIKVKYKYWDIFICDLTFLHKSYKSLKIKPCRFLKPTWFSRLKLSEYLIPLSSMKKEQP